MAEGSWTDTLSNLAQNKMFLQMLSAAGSDISQGTGGTNLNAAVQGNIQSQNFMKLMKQLLGPDGSKGTLSSAGLTLNAPPDSALYSSFLGGEGTFKMDPSLAPANAPTPTQGGTPMSFGGRSNAGNPFAISQPELNINPADLAGLTTQDLASLIGMKSEQDKLKGQSYRDLVESMYKGSAEGRAVAEEGRKAEAAPVDIKYKKALTKEAEAREKKAGQLDPLDQPHPFSITKPGGTPMTVREFNTLTTGQKERYEYANEVSKGTGQSMLDTMEALAEAQAPPPASFKEWKAAKDVSGYPDSYEQWVKDPSDWYAFKRAKGDGYKGTYPQWTEHMATISQKEREPAPMTWTTATNELTKRYGKMDPTGMWAVTPELQATHRKAQSILNEYRESKMHPLKAINEAENAANEWKGQIEKKYRDYIDKAAGDKDRIAKINSAFSSKYGYLPK